MAKQPTAKDKLLDVALRTIREKGYCATTVDDLCAAAGVTKGAFFHHFDSKEALAVAAAEHWATITGKLFESAPYHDVKDPLERVLAYIDFRRSLIRGKIPEFTCLVGTMVQETYDRNPDIRAACAASIFGHAATLVADIQAVIDEHGIQNIGCTAASLARHTQAVLQGAFILAKASGSADFAIESCDHLKRYFQLLFSTPNLKGKEDEFAQV